MALASPTPAHRPCSMGFSMAAWRAQKYGVHPIGPWIDSSILGKSLAGAAGRNHGVVFRATAPGIGALQEVVKKKW